jgi:hypothetical protein
MKKFETTPNIEGRKSVHSELLIRPDGSVLLHNLSPALAALLLVLDPEDAGIQKRAGAGRVSQQRISEP